MRSFTSDQAVAALPLPQLTDEHLAQLLRVPLGAAAVRRAQLEQLHASEAWVRETLRTLPETALVVLSTVVEHGGRISTDLLAELALVSYRMTDREVRAGIEAAIAHVLLVPVESHRGERMLYLVSPAAPLIAALVADLDLPALPRAELVPGEGLGGRALLAACMALHHLDVKLTQAGRPHRAPLKRLAKAVGVTDDLLEELLVTAMAFGLVAIEEDQEVLRPDIERLLHAAEGRYPGSAIIAALSAALERGPVSSEELQRWLIRCPPSSMMPVDVPSFAHLPGFCIGMVGGALAVGCDALGDRVAGHITPSFEVFLPPESRFTDIVRIGGCSELVRIDRMMVWRLTKASVRRAASAGMGAAQILAALAGASRTAVPQNVEGAIRDWAGGAVTATVAKGRVIVVEAASADRVRSELAQLDPRELAPGVFVVDEDTPPDVIQARLRRADVSSRAWLMPVDPQPPSPKARLRIGSAELRERIASWRQRQPEPDQAAEPPALPPHAWMRSHIGRRLQRVVPDTPLALDLGASIHQIRFARLLQRGDTWMVLGEELDTGEAVAVPLTRVMGIAVIGGGAPAGPQPRPDLPGHIRCPCGSGARYRDCCRP
jgi:hypothetical protein